MSDHFCYLRDSRVYVHENCCLGVQRHPLTYVGRRMFWPGPLTEYGICFRDTTFQCFCMFPMSSRYLRFSVGTEDPINLVKFGGLIFFGQSPL